MKNVAIVVQNLHNGGAERMAANMSKELAKENKVYLIVFDSGEAIYSYGGKLIDLKVPPVESGGVFRRILNTLKRVRRLSFIKKKYDIDLCISHMGGANLANILSRRKERVISVYHSMPSKEFKADLKNRLVQRFIGKHSDCYVMVSKPAVKDMKENFGVPGDKLKCIYNFVDAEDIRKLGDEPLDKAAEDFVSAHDKLLVHAGRLTALKAQYRLIILLKGLRDKGLNAGLILLGDGEEKDGLKKKASEYGVSGHVLFTGEAKNPFSYIRRSDVFVLCSRYEGLPMVLIEALSLKCPVVSVDMKSGAREILAPGTDTDISAEGIEYAEYGILIQPGEDEAGERFLLAAVYEMLENKELRRRYLDKCGEAVANFDAKTIISQWMNL
ncbi:MAG: glycosyltransferase [Lachnospiraceae bacterium]|nr:glycosyltransferase [Lachnospiraceae bacterium]